jgi:hypothetical protein
MFFDAEHCPQLAPLLPCNTSKGLLRGKSRLPQRIPSGLTPDDPAIKVANYFLTLFFTPIRAQAKRRRTWKLARNRKGLIGSRTRQCSNQEDSGSHDSLPDANQRLIAQIAEPLLQRL